MILLYCENRLYTAAVVWNLIIQKLRKPATKLSFAKVDNDAAKPINIHA